MSSAKCKKGPSKGARVGANEHEILLAAGQQVRVETGGSTKVGFVGWIGPGKYGGIRVGVDIDGGRREWADSKKVSPIGTWTLGHWAAMAKDVRTIAELTPEQLEAPTTEAMTLQFGSKSRFRQRVPEGTTPLHIATLWPDPPSVRALLERGARTNVLDAEGHAPGWAMCRLHANEVEAVAAELARDEAVATMLAREGLARGNGHVLMGLASAGFDFQAPLGKGASLAKRLVAEPAFGPPRRTILAAAERLASPDQVIEAPTGKTKCVACGKKIARGEMQFGKGEVTDGGRVKRRWHHLPCAREAFGRNGLLAE